MVMPKSLHEIEIRKREERIDRLERLLSIALPVARAAVLWRKTEYRKLVAPAAYEMASADLRRTVDALSPEKRAEILEGGPE